GRVHVLGPVARGEGVEDLDEVVVQGRVWRAAPDRRLPGVPVRVYEARDDDVAGRIDHLRLGVDLRLHGDDAVILDQHVPFRQVTDGRVLADYVTAADEDAVAHVRTPLARDGESSDRLAALCRGGGSLLVGLLLWL